MSDENKQCYNCGHWMVERDNDLWECPNCGDITDTRYPVDPPFDIPDLAEIDMQSTLDLAWMQIVEAFRIPKEYFNNG